MWPPYRMRAEAWRRGHGVWVLLVPRVRRERGADGRRWSELGFYPEMNPEAGDCEIVTRHDETRETGAERASACENVSVVEAAHQRGPGARDRSRRPGGPPVLFSYNYKHAGLCIPLSHSSAPTQIPKLGRRRKGGGRTGAPRGARHGDPETSKAREAPNVN